MNKTLVQEQFGKTAAHYLTATPHALGKSLRAPGRTHHAAERLARARRRHRRRPRRLHLRAACRARLGDRHHPGNARHGEAAKPPSAASPMCAPPTPRPRRCRSRMRASIWSPAASRRITSTRSRQFLAEVHRVLKPGGAVRAGRQCGAGRQRRRLRQRLRALPRSEPPARLDHGGMARRAQSRRLCRRARRADLQDDGIQELGGSATTTPCRRCCARC